VPPQPPGGREELRLGRPPVIWLHLVVQMSDTSDERRVPASPCPLNRFTLRIEGRKHVVGMVLDDVVCNGAALRVWLNVSVRHGLLSYALAGTPRVTCWIESPPGVMIGRRTNRPVQEHKV